MIRPSMSQAQGTSPLPGLGSLFDPYSLGASVSYLISLLLEREEYLPTRMIFIFPANTQFFSSRGALN